MKLWLKIFDVLSIKNASVLFIIPILLSFYNASSAEVKRKEVLDNFIRSELLLHQIPGAAMCVISGDSIKWKKAFGYADINSKKLFQTTTVINVASVSKTVIGVAIMIAAEKGLIDLDTDINRYLNNFQVKNPHEVPGASKITLRHLSTHTSGITDRREVYSNTYVRHSSSEALLKDFLLHYFSISGNKYSKDNFYKVIPGIYYHYSNIGASLAAEVLSEGTTIPFHDFCRTKIFKPLAMNNTSWFLSETAVDQHATLYDENATGIPLYDLITFPDGSLHTTLDDLAKFLLMIINGGELNGQRIIQSSSVKEMFRHQFISSSSPLNFDTAHFNQGIFWHIEKNDEARYLIGHSGGDPGVTSYMYYSPFTKAGVILLINKSLSQNENKIIKDIICRLWKFATEN